MKLLFYLSNLLFLIFWFTRNSVAVKFFATFTLSVYCLIEGNFQTGSKFVLYSIGDFVIEFFHIHYAILIFGLAKSTIDFYIFWMTLCLFNFFPKRSWVLVYFWVFFLEIYSMKSYSLLLFLISDLIIVFNIYVKSIDVSKYLTYPLY